MAAALATRGLFTMSIEMVDFLVHQTQEILAPNQCRDVAVVEGGQSWPNRQSRSQLTRGNSV